MAQNTEILDLGRIGLTSGEGRHLDLTVAMDDFSLGGQSYAAVPARVPVKLDVTRMTGGGYSLRLRYEVQLDGPCMRCLEHAAMAFRVDAREIDQPGGESDDLDSPYVDRDELDLRAWARDALLLELPSQIVCREDCKGICSVCGENLNTASPDHHHEKAPDPRWNKLSEIKFE
jgi:uncharacterized protein